MNDQIAELSLQLGEALSRRQFTVTVAESCTGGGIGYALTMVPGSSEWFKAGYITYSNDAKTALLGVEQATLDSHGAVSQPVVEAMAQGALLRAFADCSIAVSGVAGPDGGTDEKPVGTVWIAWLIEGKGVCSQECRFDGNRAQVREQAIAHALRQLMLYIGAEQNAGH